MRHISNRSNNTLASSRLYIPWGAGHPGAPRTRGRDSRTHDAQPSQRSLVTGIEEALVGTPRVVIDRKSATERLLMGLMWSRMQHMVDAVTA